MKPGDAKLSKSNASISDPTMKTDPNWQKKCFWRIPGKTKDKGRPGKCRRSLSWIGRSREKSPGPRITPAIVGKS